MGDRRLLGIIYGKKNAWKLNSVSGTSAHSVQNYGEIYVEGLNQLSAGCKNVNQGSKVELNIPKYCDTTNT